MIQYDILLGKALRLTLINFSEAFMKRIKALILGILAGISIAIGGTIYLSLDNKTVGALLFTVGLFCVCTMGFSLFTGKVCYVFDNDRDYAIDLIFIWIGNLIGTVATAFLESLTRVGIKLQETAKIIVDTKLNDKLLSIFILAIFCNIMIYIAVESYRNNPHELGKYVGLFLGISVFILCGFEHCVANMYYITMAKAWSGKAIIYLLIMTLGNAFGGVIIPLLRKCVAPEK